MNMQQLREAITERLGRTSTVSEGWVRNQIAAGHLPPPMKPSHKVAVWQPSDVDRLMDHLEVERQERQKLLAARRRRSLAAVASSPIPSAA